MVQLSPDTRLTGWDGCSGYHYSDNIIYGFSHTHLSGTGISDYGDILFMPTIGLPSLNATGENPKGYATSFNHKNETASPGYYGVKLDNGLQVDLTTTARTGLHRYTFPPDSNANNVILDLVHRDKVVDASLRVVDATHIEGFRRSNAWARNQVVYFAAEFSRPFRSSKTEQAIDAPNIKASFSFDLENQPLLLKVGISPVSVEGAWKNLTAEINHWDFERVRNDAKVAWNHELNKIQVSGGDEAQLKNFYTALYHVNLQPNLFTDIDGQYLGRDFKIHKAEGFDNYTVFSLWDTFRATHPLYTIIDQKRTADFINTFLAQYQEGGRLPVWELAANETDTMIGYHSVSVIADAILKGIGGFDRERAFQAMKHSAELKHHGLGPYTEHGYLEMEVERESVSKTLEYAYDDWCIAVVAQVLNRQDDYQRYMRRAQSYKNIFDRETGFVRPRTNAGWLSPFEPREVNFSFTEANAWQYTFFAPQDIAGLIELMGGNEKFARKLDDLFAAESKTTGREQADITGLIGQYAHGNEPSHHVAYLYNYVGQPWKTQSRVRQVMDSFYKPSPDGLIGNEDCGQMSAWYVLSAAGFYPVTPGSPVYAIGTPLFPEVRFNLENGKSFVIKARNVSTQNFYIKSAALNGKTYRKSFISHEDLIAGGELVYEMSGKPNLRWANQVGEVPVSRITTEPIVPVPLVNAAGKTFKNRIEITFQEDKAARVFYTTDGREPDAKSTPFTKAFFLDRTATVKARAIDRQGRMSQIAIANFRKMPHSWNLTLKSKYSTQYSGGGDSALIDGIRGTKNFSGGAWQGYQGQDLVAVVDLGEVKRVSKLGAGFLQEIGSWIWLPVKVDFEVSVDGQQYEHVLTVMNDESNTSYESVVKDLNGSIEPRKIRYVRLTAESYGKLPAWHAGAGGDSWIFADEIVIE
jgi:predicted alpha-1,2-mannosidase